MKITPAHIEALKWLIDFQPYTIENEHIKNAEDLLTELQSQVEKPKTDSEKISEGICISDRGVDHCPVCIDRCDASHFKRAVKELSESAQPIAGWISDEDIEAGADINHSVKELHPAGEVYRIVARDRLRWINGAKWMRSKLVPSPPADKP